MSRIITDITRTKPSRRPIRPSGDPHQRFGFLQVLRGVEVGHFYVMKSEGEIVYLGRGREATFRLSHESVSRIHASVTQDSKGGFLLKDEGSTNGTIVAGRKIKRKILYPGDKFYVGDLLLRFDLMDQEDLDFQVELRQRAAAATRDALTGLLAKAYWLEEIPKLIRFSQKKNIGLGLLVIDLDHFKEINDSHGHQAGDAVLHAVGTTILGNIRENDLSIRYGGEELIIILHDLHEQAALDAAERLRRELERSPVAFGAERLSVTASFGLAMLRESENAEQLFGRADQALYRAKAEGRNRVCLG
ncbi:MAG: hypothetical protein A2284_18540 [Deltaproteobacteria bacterium RIFOXYA12_FULL_61_11]|nr:MAG: hypothetical protein A2284_18540 [Deltaproteobacteria bacterium RIFOXYA12_FULL_61_11]